MCGGMAEWMNKEIELSFNIIEHFLFWHLTLLSLDHIFSMFAIAMLLAFAWRTQCDFFFIAILSVHEIAPRTHIRATTVHHIKK